MMRKKFLFPFLTLAVAAAFSLGACGASQGDGKSEGGNNPSGDVSDSEAEEVKINITSAGGVKEIIVGETLQLTADQEGVTWGTRNTDIVSVSDTGLVTALSAGSARITAEKEGFARGSFTLTVNKAPERPAKYTLAMEDADHYSPTDEWGSAYRQDDSSSPIHSSSGHTEDGTCLGYFSQGCKETLTFTSNKEFTAEIGVTMAYNSAMDLDGRVTVSFNNNSISMAGKSTEAPEDGDTNNYYDFHTVSFGDQKILNGTNVLVIEVVGSQAPNMDEFKIFTEEEATITVVKPVVLEKIVVTPASVTLEIDGTQQLTTVTEGVTYTSDHPEIAEVSASGLVTGKSAGNAEITVSKEGMRSAKVAVKVKAQAAPAFVYELVAGTAVKMEFEKGEFYCDAGTWGIEMSGSTMGPNHDGGDTPIEDQESASGGQSLGYFNQSSKVTLKCTSPKAGTISLKLCAASAAEFALDGQVEIKVNDTVISLTDKVIEAGGESNYYDWKVVDLGTAPVVNGANQITLEVLASQGCNLDYMEVTLA